MSFVWSFCVIINVCVCLLKHMCETALLRDKVKVQDWTRSSLAGTGPEPCQARLKLHQAPDIATDQLAFGTELSSLPTRVNFLPRVTLKGMPMCI